MNPSLPQEIVDVIFSTKGGLSGQDERNCELDVTVRSFARGEKLFGRYALRKIIGRGGMGVVWLAEDEKLERSVALKFLPEMLHRDAAARDDLKRETRKSLELTHPHIVRIYDFLEDEDAAAISMEFVEGQTLSDRRIDQPRKVLECADIAKWLPDLAAALDYAHRTVHLVHRDLKPSNVMLTTRGVVKIGDFGIACSLQNSVGRMSLLTSSGGTMAYMSPQQLMGEDPSPLDDIYALGATLYELLTSRPPFHSGDVSTQKREGQAERMTDRRVRFGIAGEPIPWEWEEAVAACLSRDPAARPQSVTELVERLGLVESRPATARTVEPPVSGKRALWIETVRAWPWRRWLADRRGRIAGGLLMLVLLALVARPFSQPEFGSRTVAPVQRGGVIVTTQPEGAAVTLGGLAMQTSPATFGGIAAGRYPLRIWLDGYEAVEREVGVKGNQFVDLGSVDLKREVGILKLETTPPGSSYAVRPKGGDGEAVREGVTPATIGNLPTGVYEVTVSREGWTSLVREMEVTKDAPAALAWQFGRGTLAVVSEPEGATVRADGEVLGFTPLRAELRSGSYRTVEVSLEGYDPVTFAADIRADEVTQPEAFQLQRSAGILEITSDPEGEKAVVYLAGSETPLREIVTPLRAGDMPTGDYRVVFQRAGWKDHEELVSVTRDAAAQVAWRFPRAMVTVKSTPAGAKVTLSGQPEVLGTTPFTMELPAGPVRLMFRKEDYPTRSREATLEDGQEITVSRSLYATSSKSSSRRKKPEPPPSALGKIGNSLKKVFRR